MSGPTLGRYTGRVMACVLDWSGTTADKYVLAPALAFTEVFKKYGVPITMQEAREPMGMRKDMHIQAIMEKPEVRERWKQKYGREPDNSDVSKVYKDFVPMQLSILKKYSELIPGAAEAAKDIRDLGCKIGMTTGFTSAMGNILRQEAERQGLRLDAHVAGDDVTHGYRPRPFMLFRNMEVMDVPHVWATIKVDDSTAGIEEGKAAGCWTVGVCRYGNYMDISSLEEAEGLSAEEITEKRNVSRDILLSSGAHYVVDSITDLPYVIQDVNELLQKGGNP